LDIELLKTFLEVNKTRHFGHAADNLYLTPAAVSARIKLLEQQLGVAVFVRQKGNIHLTSEGERLVPHAEEVVNAWAKTVQEVKLKPELDARLHIGATTGLWQLAMQTKLLEVMESYPELAILAEGQSTMELVRRLMERSLDLVLLYDPPANSGLRTEKVGIMKLVLASNLSEEERISDSNKGYIYIDWGTSFETFHARTYRESRVSRLHVNLASIALSLLEANPGSAYLPESTVESTKWLSVVPDRPTFKRPVFASYQDNNPRCDRIKDVIELIRGVSI
jgi:DNA-binding transcriptional LysR family regulator